MKVDEVEPGFWLQVALVAWNFVLTAALWLRKPGEDAARAVDALRDDMDKRLKDAGAQITEIRAHMEHMPSNDELLRLEGAVREVNERTAGLHRNIDTMNSSLRRIEDYLLRDRRP